MNRKMVDAILSISEYNRFTKGIFGWVGFKTYWLSFENVERVAGTTSWKFWGLFKYAIDGIVNFSSTPLDIASFVGIGMTFVAFIYLIFIVATSFYNFRTNIYNLKKVMPFICLIFFVSVGFKKL